MADDKIIFQEITQEQFDWIKQNFTFNHRMEYEKLDFYGTQEDPLFQLKKDSKEECHIVFVVETNKPIKRVSVNYLIIINNSQYGGEVVEKNPRRLLERVMRHYPPNTNIYERETTKNSMLVLSSELKRKDEEPVKPKRIKI